MTKFADHITQIGEGYLVWVPFTDESQLPTLEELAVYAAAPDLLAALEEALLFIDNTFAPGADVADEQARAAIAKAKGTPWPDPTDTEDFA